ncbi:hypothetical protein EH243_11515 [Amphritea opalescens]|uniref:DUF5610 domain-containing protein n=1 Tax=Amphritea opalescens TaxID=2490544 RepID=A0A430KQ21_9GAMM|nr:hypothetical protein [Amphritea opalescens]RTE65562.1 hypothetical protein EH243_11515 [Amphritea opalescens]
MFNLSSIPLLLNSGLSQQSGSQASAVPTESSLENLSQSLSAVNNVAATEQTYSLSERFSRDDSFSLSLTTQDGDQVEITFSSETSYQSEYVQSGGNGEQEQRYSIDKAQSSEFGFSVTGELDADELDAIASLVQDLSSLAANFFNGDLQTAMQQAGDLSFDTSELAQMDLSMQQSMEYRAVEQYRAVQSLGENSVAAPQQALTPFIEQLQGLVDSSQTYIESAASVSMSLLVTLVEHDFRFTDADEVEQGAMKENLARLNDQIHNGERSDHTEANESEQASTQGHKHDADESRGTRHDATEPTNSIYQADTVDQADITA